MACHVGGGSCDPLCPHVASPMLRGSPNLSGKLTNRDHGAPICILISQNSKRVKKYANLYL